MKKYLEVELPIVSVLSLVTFHFNLLPFANLQYILMIKVS